MGYVPAWGDLYIYFDLLETTRHPAAVNYFSLITSSELF